jgi:hypothetical protein
LSLDRPWCPPRRAASELSEERVNAIPALAVLAVVGLTVAGCGVKALSGPITVAGIATIANVKVGTLIRCKGGPAARTPHWFGSSYLRVPGVPGVIHLKRRHNGSVAVSCRP